MNKSKEYDYELLADFRSECLPFGKYPEYIIQEFLNKRYERTNKIHTERG